MPVQYWAVWYPKAAATGLLVGRAQVDSTSGVLLHAAPEVITVEVYDAQGQLMALGKNLSRTMQSPISQLEVQGTEVVREDLWPDQRHIGATVLLPGGEAGVLRSWWNSDNQQEWRWQVEFYNQTA
jgi:hypothetical protein